MSSFQEQETCFPEGEASLALIDRPRWGWTAGAGVDDLLTPHEVSGENLSGIVPR